MDDTPFDVKAGHLGEKHLHISIVTVDVAQRRSYLAGREDAGGYLVEKRLEEMMVAPVDQRDIDVARSGQQPTCGKSSKAATYDHDTVTCPRLRRRLPSVLRFDGDQPRGGVDQRQMRERLGVIPEMASRLCVDLLGVEQQWSGKGEQLLE